MFLEGRLMAIYKGSISARVWVFGFREEGVWGLRVCSIWVSGFHAKVEKLQLQVLRGFIKALLKGCEVRGVRQ